MDYKVLLETEISKGFSRSDLEYLIGLPKNNLSSFLNGKRFLSKKSFLKIERWLQSKNKPDPLNFKRLLDIPKNQNIYVSTKPKLGEETKVTFEEAKINSIKQEKTFLLPHTLPKSKITEFRPRMEEETGINYKIAQAEWELNNK